MELKQPEQKALRLGRQRMAKTWFIGDTHFGHHNIIEYCGRPDDHEDRMWRSLQEKVQPQDSLVHVGDVCLIPTRDIWDLLDRLPGERKILVEGNHDARMKKIRKWSGWESVTRYKKVWAWISGGIRVAVSHRTEQLQDAAADILIHGHTHDKGVPFHWEGSKNRLWVNVCVEQTNYEPISWIEILRKYEEFL